MDKIYFKDIPGFEGIYAVTTCGKVWSHRRGIWLRPSKPNGYLCVHLRVNCVVTSRSVHRLVMLTYVDNAENKPEVNHINGVKTDNYLHNLEWVTHSENNQHAWDTGLRSNTELNSISAANNCLKRSCIPILQLDKSTLLAIKEHPSAEEAARVLGGYANPIRFCCKGKKGYKSYKGFLWTDKEGYKSPTGNPILIPNPYNNSVGLDNCK